MNTCPTCQQTVFGPFDKLSKTEKVVVVEIALGLSAKEIAAKLSISVKTVGVHKHNIRTKLGIHNDIKIHQLALEHGIITSKPSTEEAGWWNCQAHGHTPEECKCGAATAFVTSRPRP